MRLAVVQYRPEFLNGWSGYADKLDAVVGAACRAGAALVAFPELAGLELASLLPPAELRDPVRLIAALQDLVPEALAIHVQVARRHGCMVVAGSLPVRVDAALRERVHVFGPAGLVGVQDGLAGSEEWGLSGSGVVTVFPAPFGRIAVAVGGDACVPAVVGAMAGADARLVVAATRSDTPAAANRARLCARARAAEHLVYVAHAPLVGDCDWLPALAANLGTAAIFTPLGDGFPADGVLAQAVSDAPQVVLGELDFGLIGHAQCARTDAVPFTVEVAG